MVVPLVPSPDTSRVIHTTSGEGVGRRRRHSDGLFLDKIRFMRKIPLGSWPCWAGKGGGEDKGGQGRGRDGGIEGRSGVRFGLRVMLPVTWYQFRN